MRLEDLFVAVEQGDCQTLLTAIKAGFDINNSSHPSDGSRLIHFAAVRNQTEFIKLLLNNGAKDDIKNREGNTPLCLAAIYGQLEAMQVILEHNPNMYLEIDQQNSNTPFHLAAKEGKVNIVEFFLSKEINPNIQNYELETPLHWAAGTGQNKVIQLLLAHGAYSSIRNIYNVTPLHVAAKQGHAEAIKILLEYKASPNAKQGKHLNLEAPLHLAIRAETLEGVKLLLHYGANPNMKTIKFQESNGNYLSYLDGSTKLQATPLYLAARYGQFEMVKALIDKGAILDNFDKYQGDRGGDNSDGSNPIVVAASKSCDMVKYLLDIAKYNTKNYKTWLNDALHAAVLNGCIENVQYILSLKTEINGNTDYNNPLFEAVSKNKLDVVKLLIKSGADIHHKNSYGTNILHMVENSNPVLTRYFVDLKVDTESKGCRLYGCTPYDRKHTPLEDYYGFCSAKIIVLCSRGAYIDLSKGYLHQQIIMSWPNFIFSNKECTLQEKVAAALNIIHAFSQLEEEGKNFANNLSSKLQPHIQSLIHTIEPCSRIDVTDKCRNLGHLDYLAKIAALTKTVRCGDESLLLLLSKLLDRITEIKDTAFVDISNLLSMQIQRKPVHNLSKIVSIETDILSDIIKYLDSKSIMNWWKTRGIDPYNLQEQDHTIDLMEVDLNGNECLNKTVI